MQIMYNWHYSRAYLVHIQNPSRKPDTTTHLYKPLKSTRAQA